MSGSVAWLTRAATWSLGLSGPFLSSLRRSPLSLPSTSWAMLPLSLAALRCHSFVADASSSSITVP
eukprot:1762886-Rhodomonas_salina.1